MEKENLDYQTLTESTKMDSNCKIEVLYFTENKKHFNCNKNFVNSFVFCLKNDNIIIDKYTNNDENTMSLNTLLIKDIIGFSLNAFVVEISNADISKGKEILNKKLKYNLLDELKSLKDVKLNEEPKRKIIINLSINLLSKNNKSCCGSCCCCCRSKTKDRELVEYETFILVNSISKLDDLNTFIRSLSKYLNLSIKNEANDKNNDINEFCQQYSHLDFKDNNITLPIVKKKYLLYLNPIGGQGTALNCWKKVEKLFVNKSSFIEIETFYTDYYRHAYDNTLNIKDNNSYQGIICCSGDGIIHEVINAIMERDRINNEFWDISVGVIPAGTSNALAKTLVDNAEAYELNEVNAAYLILRGDSMWIDLAEIEFLNDAKKVYFFLSLCYGIIADVDLESEL